MLQDAQMTRCVIVASGQSAAGFVPPDGVAVIAVNGVIDWIPRADHWFTLDPSAANMARINIPRAGTHYHAAIPAGMELPEHVNVWERVPGREDSPSAETHSPRWWFWRWSARTGIDAGPGRINTGNSAWGALQLAYKLGAKKVALVGVDADQRQRVEGGQSNNLSHLPMLFESALGREDFQFVNCGRMKSRVPTMTIEGGMKWLMQ